MEIHKIKEKRCREITTIFRILYLWKGYTEDFSYICKVLFLKLSCEYTVLNTIFDIFICLKNFIILKYINSNSQSQPY